MGMPGDEVHVWEIFQQGCELVEEFLLSAAGALEVVVDGISGESSLVAHNGAVERHYQRGVLVLDGGQVLLHPLQLVGGEVVVVVALAGDAFVAVYTAFAVAVDYVVKDYVVLASEIE